MQDVKSEYAEIYDPGHPLAGANGMVKRHRWVLYNKIGPGEHPCVICGWMLPWKGPKKTNIYADHINGIKGDDRPENLQVACYWCNLHRNWAEPLFPHAWAKVLEENLGVPPGERPWLGKVWGARWGWDADKWKRIYMERLDFYNVHGF